MVKKKTSKKKVVKHTKNKKHNLLDTPIGPKNFIKKYPGFIIAIIFAAIIVGILLTTIEVPDPELETKLIYAQQMHIENTTFVEETLFALNAELDGEYDEVLEDDYIFSIISDIEWFAAMETYIYTSKPSKDIFVKEIAVAAFRNRLIEINEQFVFEMIGFEQDYTIKSALEREPVQNFVTAEELNEVFGEDEHDKLVFLETLNFIVKNYFEEKKRLINNSISIERKFIEAKKLNLFSY
jgi:hypothetical protein